MKVLGKISCSLGVHKPEIIPLGIGSEVFMVWHYVCIRCNKCLALGTYNKASGELDELEYGK